ncbi:MAG: ATP-binding protein [Desulfosoma sp.]
MITADERYYSSLRRNIMAIIITVALMPLLAMMAIAGYQFHTAYRYKVVDHLAALVDRHTLHIDSFLSEKLADISTLAAIKPLEKLQDPAEMEKILGMFQEKHRGVFVDLGLVDERGFQVAYAGPFRLTQAQYGEASWFQESIRQPFTVSDVFLGLRGIPHFIVAVRIESGGHLWVLRSTIDFMAFNRLVEDLRIGKTGQAFIVNAEGQFQTQPHAQPGVDPQELLRVVRGETPKEIHPTAVEGLEIMGSSGNVYKMPTSSHGASWFEYTVPQSQRRYLVFYQILKGGRWYLFYLQEVEDAFHDLYKARTLTLLVLAFSALGVAVTAWALSRRVVQRIIQVDREKEMMNEQVIEAGKLASIGELAAGIAHEINNPVAIMVEEAGWIQDLLEDLDRGQSLDVEEVRRSLQQIRTQGARCKEITHKLLSFARRTDPTVQQVQLNKLIREVVALVEQRARYAGVTIRTHLTDGLPWVAMSPSEMQQVLLNLINNALDAMEKTGGTLDITTRFEDGRVIVDVADTGEGIPQAILQRIFDPFFTTKPVGKGTGLGLSICYGIIRKLGGDISVNSAVGVGTTFHIYLPPGDGVVETPPPGPETLSKEDS